MRRIVYYRFGGREVHLPKLIGAFILFAALLMFLQSVASMFDSWNALGEYPNCLKQANAVVDDRATPELQTQQLQLAQLKYMDCKDSLYKTTGVQLRGNQSRITARQFWSALLQPIAVVLFWAVVFVFGIIIYKTGNLMLPIEETVRELPEKPRKKKK